MQSITKFIGLDVPKEKIAVAIAEAGREEPRWYGTIPHTPEALRKLIKQLGNLTTLAFCYEAGPTGYETYRWIESMGASCSVIAPSLIPKRAGNHIKTDRRDPLQLARLFRSGELTAIYVPTRDDEALRDLVRRKSRCKRRPASSQTAPDQVSASASDPSAICCFYSNVQETILDIVHLNAIIMQIEQKLSVIALRHIPYTIYTLHSILRRILWRTGSYNCRKRSAWQ